MIIISIITAEEPPKLAMLETETTCSSHQIPPRPLSRFLRPASRKPHDRNDPRRTGSFHNTDLWGFLVLHQ